MTYLTHLETTQLQSIAADLAAELSKIPNRHAGADKAHSELAVFLSTLEGSVVVSGYPCGLYEHLYKGWRRVDRKALADGARERTECLWVSPGSEVQGVLFGG